MKWGATWIQVHVYPQLETADNILKYSPQKETPSI